MFALAGWGPAYRGGVRPGFPAAQIFAPGSEDVVAIEPMAAPTNALRAGGYRSAVPGRPAESVFSIRVR